MLRDLGLNYRGKAKLVTDISKHVFVKQGQISVGVQIDIKGKMNEMSHVEKRIGVPHMCLGL